MSLKASFIGLGNMGAPIASNLLKRGVELGVYNRSIDKAKPLVDAGAKLLASPTEAFKNASIVFSMVSNDDALEAITEGPNGLLASAKQGCIHVSLSTVAPATTQKLALKHQEKGIQFIASPVFGRPDAAAKAELWVCMSGDPASKKKVEPFLNMIGKKVYDFGELTENANIVKLAGNFMILSVIEMLGEAFAFSKINGIHPEQLHAFLTETLFPSPVFLNYGKQLLQQKFTPAGFKMPLGLKDINLFLNSAKTSAVSLPFAQLLQEQLQTSLDKGREEMDWSAISLLPFEEGSKN